MKSTIGFAVIILFWIIFCYIVNSIVSFQPLGTPIFTIASLGGLGFAIEFTIQYIVEVVVVLFVVLLGSIYPNSKMLMGLLIILESLAVLYTVGVFS